MVFATPSQRGHTFFDMTPNVRCSSRDLVIKFYFKTTALSFKRECVSNSRLWRFGCEAPGALPLGESVASGEEHLRLWRGDPSGDIRELGGSLAASLLLATRPAAGGSALARRHSHRFGLPDRVSDPLLPATYDLSDIYRY